MKNMYIFNPLNIKFKKISFISFFIVTFYKSFLKLRIIFKPFIFLYKQLLWHCVVVKIIYVQMFLSQCFKYSLLAFVYLIIQWHISPLFPFSIMNSTSTSINNLNFSFVFFKNACKAEPSNWEKFAQPIW